MTLPGSKATASTRQTDDRIGARASGRRPGAASPLPFQPEPLPRPAACGRSGRRWPRPAGQPLDRRPGRSIELRRRCPAGSVSRPWWIDATACSASRLSWPRMSTPSAWQSRPVTGHIARHRDGRLGYNAQHRLAAPRGSPSELITDLSDHRGPRRRPTATLWLICREAIDAGAADVAVDWARHWSRPAPHDQAVLVAVSGRHRQRGPLARRSRHRPRPWPASDRRRRPRRPRRRRGPLRELVRVPAAPRRRPATTRRDRLPVAIRLRATSRRRRSSRRDRGAGRRRSGRRRPRAATSTGETPPPTPVVPEANASAPTTAGPASPPPNNRSSPSSPKASPTPRSPNASSWAEPPSRPTSSTSSPSSASAPAPNSPPKPRRGRCQHEHDDHSSPVIPSHDTHPAERQHGVYR